MKTVIQKIGPLYGEAINGSVFGQPNGSEAVLKKDVAFSVIQSRQFVKKNSSNVPIMCESDGTRGIGLTINYTYPSPVVLYVHLYSDSACTTVMTGYGYGPATAKTVSFDAFAWLGLPALVITPGTTYYARLELYQDSVMVWNSGAIPFEGVA